VSGSDNKKYSIKFISEYIDASIVGDDSLQIDNIATLDSAVKGSVTFLANSKYIKLLGSTKASAVILKKGIKTNNETTLLVCSDPYLAFAKLSNLFSDEIDFFNGSFQDSVFIHDSVNLGKDVKVGPNVYIGKNCEIGDKTVIYPNSTILKDVSIGQGCIVHPNSVLGSDGFGFAPEKESYQKIEQLGGLAIGDNVEIGAGCTIDRGAISNTIISDGVKLDNQIHIAHNVSLGANSAIAACCAIAGSTKIGKNFKMGGLSGVLGHLEICDDVTVGAHTLITKSIKSSGNYIGIMPAQNHMNWSKSAVFIKKRGK
jgi:UDP-3-O-[3-hydroxymyristoyl] glucosamine N-acyltransferase